MFLNSVCQNLSFPPTRKVRDSSLRKMQADFDHVAGEKGLLDQERLAQALDLQEVHPELSKTKLSGRVLKAFSEDTETYAGATMDSYVDGRATLVSCCQRVESFTASFNSQLVPHLRLVFLLRRRNMVRSETELIFSSGSMMRMETEPLNVPIFGN